MTIEPVQQRRFMATRKSMSLRGGFDDQYWDETTQRRSFSSRKSAARWVAKGALSVRRIARECTWLDHDDSCACRYCADDHALAKRLIERLARLILRRTAP